MCDITQLLTLVLCLLVSLSYACVAKIDTPVPDISLEYLRLFSSFTNWETRRRWLLVFEPEKGDPRSAEILAAIADQPCAAALRRLNVIYMPVAGFGGRCYRYYYSRKQHHGERDVVPYGPGIVRGYYQLMESRFGMAPERFYVALLGYKTELVKYWYDEAPTVEEIFQTVDATPDRQSELQEEQEQGVFCKTS